MKNNLTNIRKISDKQLKFCHKQISYISNLKTNNNFRKQVSPALGQKQCLSSLETIIDLTLLLHCTFFVDAIAETKRIFSLIAQEIVISIIDVVGTVKNIK